MSAELITLDFESYYGTGCNIKSLGTSQYVAHPDFEVLCLTYKTQHMPRSKPLIGSQIDEFFDRLRPIRDRVVLCAHNMYFDGYVAYYHYDFIPAYYLCTYSMARPIHGLYGPLDLDTLSKHYGYGGKVQDVLPKWRNVHWADATPEMRRELLHYGCIDTDRDEQILLEMLPNFPRFELDIIDLTLRMFNDPMLEADRELAERIIADEQEKKLEALEAVGVEEAIEVRGDKRFAELLESRGYEVPMKWSAKQEKEIPALAKADLPFQKMRDSDDPELRALIEARLVNKSSINETRAKKFLDRYGKPVPIYLGYCAAHTMRWGGGDGFNPQNMPREGDLRKCLRAPDGYKLVIADAAQIEARMNAVFCGQWDLVDEFRAFDADEGPHVYASFGEEIYGYHVDKYETPEEYAVGKAGILGLGFNCGAWKFQNMLEVGALGPPVKISLQESEVIVSRYRKKNYKIRKMWRELQGLLSVLLPGTHDAVEFNGLVIEPGGTVLMPNGLRLHYPGLDFYVGEYGTAEFTYCPWKAKFNKFVVEKLYGGLFLENIIQCLARITTAGHMLELSRFHRVVMMSHDEVVMCVPESKAETCLKDALEIMAIPPPWNEECPLQGEGKITEAYEK